MFLRRINSLQSFFLSYVIFLIMGYLFLGKGFAYIGYNNFYVSELGVIICVFIIIRYILQSIYTYKLHNNYSVKLIYPIVFLIFLNCWQLFILGNNIEYGILAFRDSVIWGYSIFLFAVYFASTKKHIESFIIIIRNVIPFYLIWLVFTGIVRRTGLLADVFIHGTNISIIYLKGGDVGVFLGGIAAFVLLRLDKYSEEWSNFRIWIIWTIWIITCFLYTSGSRGGMFSALLAILLIIWFKKKVRIIGRLLIVILFTVMVFLLFNIKIGNSTYGRTISLEQIAYNIVSTFSNIETKETTQELDTKRWRLEWWEKIINYTFWGKHFIFGKGYGINLAYDDGIITSYQLLRQNPLRSPHNAHMTILARSGVPGFLLWCVFLLSFFSLFLVRINRRQYSHKDKTIIIWLCSVWLVFLFNASFDVFLENPMGGIPFWCLCGASLSYIFKRGHRIQS